MYAQDIAVITSKNLAKSGGIQSVTQTLFHDIFPIFFYENGIDDQIFDFRTIVFSGFDHNFVDLARSLKDHHINIAVFWHFSCASEVDPDVGESWRSVVPLLVDRTVDLFITCKAGFDNVVSNLFGIPTFFILNNAVDTSFRTLPKHGLGIYSGSSDYWVKNLRPNLYATLMTGLPVDILPYDDTIRSVVEMLGKTSYVTGITDRLDHSAFLKRMSSCELVSYVTFTEGAPILPLEALNNGVICLTGYNHHYFQSDSRLSSLLMVNRPDDPVTISQAILKALDNKKEILERYQIWKAHYDVEQRTNFDMLLQQLTSL